MRLLRVRFDDSWGKIPCERGTRRVWLCFAPAIWSLYSGRLHAMEWSLLWSPLDHAVTFYPVASLYQCDKTHRELAQAICQTVVQNRAKEHPMNVPPNPTIGAELAWWSEDNASTGKSYYEINNDQHIMYCPETGILHSSTHRPTFVSLCCFDIPEHACSLDPSRSDELWVHVIPMTHWHHLNLWSDEDFALEDTEVCGAQLLKLLGVLIVLNIWPIRSLTDIQRLISPSKLTFCVYMYLSRTYLIILIIFAHLWRVFCHSFLFLRLTDVVPAMKLQLSPLKVFVVSMCFSLFFVQWSEFRRP